MFQMFYVSSYLILLTFNLEQPVADSNEQRVLIPLHSGAVNRMRSR